MKLTVLPFGGLGNRMRVIDSAFLVSEQNNKSPVNLIWLRKWELNAPFYSIFQPFPKPLNLVDGAVYYFFLYLVKHIYVQKFEKLYRFIFKLYYDLVLLDNDIKEKQPEEIYGLTKGKKRILIASCYGFQNSSNFESFNPSDNVKKQLDRLNLPESYIGVHIRRTDHSTIIKESGLEEFVKACDKEISENNEVKFFLATDDRIVKSTFQNQFGERLITQETELSRDSEEGIIGAYVDILALSGAEKIICNLKSSFAETAIKIGKIKEVIEI
ncbi:hypothetical protein [Jiulongibacter sediminis]|jgi:hypothetical protein|uniref:hypothetical protein n=1 Tax=Jiulongibacter sediminis TaxID=1605367 RepID=UPI0026F11178|nr:hypothetical protein [Jiulongibacter sediminis]